MAQDVYVVDDDSLVRRWTTALLTGAGYRSRPFASGNDFIDSLSELGPGCVVMDMHMPGLDGLQTFERLRGAGRDDIACIFITGSADVAMAVRAMKMGATEFIEKPINEDALLALLAQTFTTLERDTNAAREREEARQRIGKLSRRETEVLEGLISGRPNKVIAHDLHISVRTVEMHRGKVMERLGVRTFGEAMRMAFVSGLGFQGRELGSAGSVPAAR